MDHKGTYWRVSDRVQSIDAATVHAGDVAASREETSFDHDECQGYAVDQREERE